jgi:hypothetical protein
MSSRKIVCPFDHALIRRFSEREICVRVDDPARIPGAAAMVRESNNRLVCVILDSGKTVDGIELSDEWKDIPIALMAQSMGKFRNVDRSLPLLRKLNLRVFLPYSAENMTGIRILASVGVPCCIVLESAAGGIQWEDLADLMTYSLLEGVPHAPIEPFSYIARHYAPSDYLKWGAAYFEDPDQFLHLDAGGQVALSRGELLDGAFIGHIDEVESAPGCPALEARVQEWRNVFIKNESCSGCRGFRVCLGKFMREKGDSAACSGFFAEMMEAVEQYLAQNAPVGDTPVWQL